MVEELCTVKLNVLVSIVRARKVVVMRFASEERSLPNDDSVAWQCYLLILYWNLESLMGI